MKSLIFILIGLYLSWHYTDLASDSSIQNALAPLGVFIFLILLAMWFVSKGDRRGGTGTSGGSGDYSGDSCSGGDGGGCD